MTVRGPVAAGDLGHVQVHEHLLVDLSRASYRWDYEALLDDPVVAGDELVAYREAGGTTICDLTTPDIGRNPRGLRLAAERSGVHVVMGCGWYRWPFYPEEIDRTATATLAARLVDEIRDGDAETGIRPGVIGEIGSDKRWVRGVEERVFRAAAVAQARTGLAIMTHAAPGAGIEQLDILVDAGADPRRIAIGHADALLDDGYHKALLERGAYLSFDLVGLSVYPDDRRARHLADLVRAGHLSSLLVSTDICHRSRLRAWSGAGYGFLIESFLPRLTALGLGAAELRALTVDNPGRFLVGS